MHVSMYFLHLELTFTLHYIITDKGLFSTTMYMYITSSFARFCYLCVHRSDAASELHILVSRLFLCLFVCTLGCEQQYFPNDQLPRQPGSRLPHGLGVGSPPSLSFFPRLPHGVGVGLPPSLSLFVNCLKCTQDNILQIIIFWKVNFAIFLFSTHSV